MFYVEHGARCNPAPSDGSAPNLVDQQIDEKGNVHQFWEFNTEACEQINFWLGGFESILKIMTVHNFNWFLYAMLFYYCKAKRRKNKQTKQHLVVIQN